MYCDGTLNLKSTNIVLPPDRPHCASTGWPWWFDTMFRWILFGVLLCLPTSAWLDKNWTEMALPNKSTKYSLKPPWSPCIPTTRDSWQGNNLPYCTKVEHIYYKIRSHLIWSTYQGFQKALFGDWTVGLKNLVQGVLRVQEQRLPAPPPHVVPVVHREAGWQFNIFFMFPSLLL